MDSRYLESAIKAFTITFDDSAEVFESSKPENGKDDASFVASQEMSTKNLLYIYHPSERLKGNVRLLISRDLDNVNLVLNVEGTFKINSEQPTYQPFHIFFVSTGLLPMRPDQISMTLSSGEHIFPFEFVLPAKCPSTINLAPDISVGYVVKSVLYFVNSGLASSSINGHESNAEVVVEKGFVITQNIPHVNCEYALVPYQINLEKYRPKLDDPLHRNLLTKIRGVIQLNRRAFQQGDTIIINSEINNQSHRRTITGLLVKLGMDVCFQTPGQPLGNESKKSVHKVVAYVLDNHSVGHKQVRKWRDLKLKVPRFLPASGINSSQIYSVDYKLLFEVKFQNVPKPIPYQVIPVIVGVVVPNHVKEIAASPQLHHDISDKQTVRSFIEETGNFDNFTTNFNDYPRSEYSGR